MIFAIRAKRFRLIFPHPEELWSSKSRKGDICSALAQDFLPDLIIEIFCLGLCAAVIPEDGRTDHFVLIVQNYKAMHLASAADPGDLSGVKAFEQLRDSQLHGFPPVGGVLLAPAGLGELQRIFLRDNIQNITFFICKEKFAGGSAKIDPNIKHRVSLAFIHSPVQTPAKVCAAAELKNA